jgi:uroporphyrinogen decarboxylase
MAIRNEFPDRLPVTTHHIIPYFLQKYMNEITNDEFFEYFGLDIIEWVVPHKPDEKLENYYNPAHNKVDLLHSREIMSDNWRFERE